ncbi:MAG: SH3 domain-containing protein [bacterium]
MIRLTLLLCAGLYVGLMVLGEDHGQRRYGLMMADKLKPSAEVQAEAEPVAVMFVPAQPVMKPVVAPAEAPVAQPSDVLAPTLVSATPDTALPAPEVPGGVLYTVTANIANVRSGPGIDFGVVGSVTHDEEVLVVAEDNAVDGWSRILVEGDGTDGYVATRLLQISN